MILYSYYNTGQSGKTFNYKRLRQTRSAFNEHVSLKQICKFQTRIFTSTFFRFVHYAARMSDHRCLGMCSQSTLHDRMLGLYSLQPYPHDYLRIHKMRFCKYWYCLGWCNYWRVNLIYIYIKMNRYLERVSNKKRFWESLNFRLSILFQFL